MYLMVTHSLQDAMTGALGVIHVEKDEATKTSAEPSSADALAQAKAAGR